MHFSVKIIMLLINIKQFIVKIILCFLCLHKTMVLIKIYHFQYKLSQSLYVTHLRVSPDIKLSFKRVHNFKLYMLGHSKFT